ncbi:MAG: hypothetical protein HC773_14980 [Scytonema sp. CRU_2_7]|nr:hypothetical protein [Scytonema sp. CRU_2_7]
MVTETGATAVDGSPGIKHVASKTGAGLTAPTSLKIQNFKSPSSPSSPEEILNSSTPFFVFGDPNRLQQIAWNLLSNALKFTPQDGRVEVRLSISSEFPVLKSHCVTEPARTPQNSVLIQVSDTGSGISPDFLPHVFDRFRQADGSITRSQGGLGLGLAIVRHLVEMHGGSVHAESPGVGQGATFWVQLPLIDTRRASAQEAQKEGEGEREVPLRARRGDNRRKLRCQTHNRLHNQVRKYLLQCRMN